MTFGSAVKIFCATALLAISASGRAQERYWQCAAFAREFSGLHIRANALDWWTKAQGLYKRGFVPRIGAVMAFVPSGPMRLGHVATVTRIEGPRDIAVTHANWSPIDGMRGQIEYDVAVRDVSDANDWSRVRVWYAPLGDLGTTAWPVQGFIYPDHVEQSAESAVPHNQPLMLNLEGQEVKPERDRRTALLSPDVLRLAKLEARLSP